MKQDNINNMNNDDVSMYYPDGDAKNIYRDDHDDSFLLENQRKKERVKKKNSRLTKSQKTLITVIAVIYAVFLIAAAWLILYKPSSSGEAEIPFDTRPVEDDRPPLDNTGENDGETAPPVDTDYTQVDGIYNFLLVGHDAAANLADVTMIINLNTADNSITVMQIPRDTLVTIGVESNKVNAAYSSFWHQSYGEDDRYTATMEKYTELFEKSLCINIHYTAVLNLEGFRNIVDAIGGVDVYIPCDMEYNDPYQNLYINLSQGNQHLDGYMAECFVRFRSGFLQADIGRINAQKIFMTAFFNKVKSTLKSLDFSALSSLADEVAKNVHTDLSIADIVYYARYLTDIDLSNINMLTVPGGVEKTGVYYVVNREGTLDAVNNYFNIYKGDISDSIFDRNKVFCFTDNEAISDVYYADPDSIIKYVYNAEEIDQDSIDIPHS